MLICSTQHPAWWWWIMILVSGSKHRSCIVLICSLQYSSSPPASRLQPRVEQLYWGTFNWKPTAVWRFQDRKYIHFKLYKKIFLEQFPFVFVCIEGWWLCDIFKFSLSVHWERECFALLGSSHSVHCATLCARKLRKEERRKLIFRCGLSWSTLTTLSLESTTLHYTLHCTAQ